MRHQRSGKKLGRDSAHRKALYANLTGALIEHGRIKTTVTKAKAVKPIAEQMITLGRRGDLHARRQATAFLRSKDVVHKLFAEVGPQFAERPGGYTRIVKIGPRYGDAADMVYLELVDSTLVFKTRLPRETADAIAAAGASTPATRRGRRGRARPRRTRPTPSRRPRATRPRPRPTPRKPSAEDASRRPSADCRRAEERVAPPRRRSRASSAPRSRPRADQPSEARRRREAPADQRGEQLEGDHDERRRPRRVVRNQERQRCRTPRNVPMPVIARACGLPRPVSSPVSESPSEYAIDTPAASDSPCRRRTRSAAVRGEQRRRSAPALRASRRQPTIAGCTRCSRNDSSVMTSYRSGEL